MKIAGAQIATSTFAALFAGSLKALIKSVTVSQNPSGKYYVSILVNQEEKERLYINNNDITNNKLYHIHYLTKY